MDKQEVFDKVATHLLTQMAKARDEENCLYRTPDGLKCAIGCLIPDDKYRSDFEGLGAGFILSRGVLPILTPDAKSESEWIGYLQRLQNTHDYSDLESWFFDLEDVALDYKLSTECLEPFRKFFPPNY